MPRATHSTSLRRRLEAASAAVGAVSVAVCILAPSTALKAAAAAVAIAVVAGLWILLRQAALLSGSLVDSDARLRAVAAEQEALLAAEREARTEAESARKTLLEENQQLHDLDRMKDDFVAAVSHELRTPLTSITGYLELVLDGEAGALNAEQIQFLGVAQRNTGRLLRLVGDLLFVARVEAGKMALDTSPVDLHTLVFESVEAASLGAEAKEIELLLSTDAIDPIEADPARLAQVIDNLVSNAIKFTPRGGRVEVRSFAEGGYAVVEVGDTGMGISAEDQAQLFERFFRTESATSSAIQGTGLGLAIAKAIVEAHGGEILVESQVGSGTTFRVTLPLGAVASPERVAVQAAS